MSYPQRLLEHDERLAKGGKGRPRQADLRRAVSAAYYSAFHLLTAEYAELFAEAPTLRVALARTVNHQEIAAAALPPRPQLLPRNWPRSPNRSSFCKRNVIAPTTTRPRSWRDMKRWS